MASYRRQLEHWAHLDLDLTNTQSIQRAFEEVAKPEKSLSKLLRVWVLKFNFRIIIQKAGYVHIPAWRHALINIDHPLLRMGLSIIDTRSLNALGLEPELTLSFCLKLMRCCLCYRQIVVSQLVTFQFGIIMLKI